MTEEEKQQMEQKQDSKTIGNSMIQRFSSDRGKSLLQRSLLETNLFRNIKKKDASRYILVSQEKTDSTIKKFNENEIPDFILNQIKSKNPGAKKICVREVSDGRQWDLFFTVKNNSKDVAKWCFLMTENKQLVGKKNDFLGNLILSMQNHIFDNLNINKVNWWDGAAGTWNKAFFIFYVLLGLIYITIYSVIASSQFIIKEHFEAVFFYFFFGILCSILPYIWIWLESPAFWDWSKYRYRSNEKELQEEREKFKIHLEHSKAVWLVISGFFALMYLNNLK